VTSGCEIKNDRHEEFDEGFAEGAAEIYEEVEGELDSAD
jgi:hypothetical protein